MIARIDPVADRTAFLEAWRRLYAAADAPSFYQSPAWFAAWLAGKPGGVTVYALRIEQEESPALMAAFGLSDQRRPPLIGARQACCLEFGDPARDAVYVEFNDFLVAGGVDGAELRREAAAALFLTLKEADVFVFKNARPMLMEAVGEAANAARLKACVINTTPTFQGDLAAARPAGGFLKTVKGSAQEQVSRSMRLYSARGDLRIEAAQTAEERRAAYARIKALHAATWARRGGSGVYANPAFAAFHERLMQAAPEAVSLCTIFAGDDIIGGLHNFIHRDRVLNYQSGFRYEDDNRLKPGLVSHTLAAQHYLDAGYNVYDFLAGKARYKKSLGAEGETLSTVVIERPGVRAKVRSGLKRLKAAAGRSGGTRRT
ncbi:MAG: GNAT family N-acetyltransferase [Parvularculaceae bacterium]